MLTNYIDSLKNGSAPIRKKLKKRGTLTEGVVESTPVVWKERLLRFEWVRSSLWGEGHGERKEGYYHFVNMETERESSTPL